MVAQHTTPPHSVCLGGAVLPQGPLTVADLLSGNGFGDATGSQDARGVIDDRFTGRDCAHGGPDYRTQHRGHEAVVCAPSDSQQWAQSLGVQYVPVGPWLRGTARQPTGTVPTAQQRRRDMIEGTVADQFAALTSAAESGCDVVVGGGGLAIAAHSVIGSAVMVSRYVRGP